MSANIIQGKVNDRFHFLPLFDFPEHKMIISETALQQPSPSSSQRESYLNSPTLGAPGPHAGPAPRGQPTPPLPSYSLEEASGEQEHALSLEICCDTKSTALGRTTGFPPTAVMGHVSHLLCESLVRLWDGMLEYSGARVGFLTGFSNKYNDLCAEWDLTSL